MKLLLDQGLPRSTVSFLHEEGTEAMHVGDLGLSRADDPTILEHARGTGHVVVTLDADFHTHLALSGQAAPSVIRVRIEGLKGPELAECLLRVILVAAQDLEAGAMVTVDARRVRVRRLPLIR